MSLSGWVVQTDGISIAPTWLKEHNLARIRGRARPQGGTPSRRAHVFMHASSTDVVTKGDPNCRTKKKSVHIAPTRPIATHSVRVRSSAASPCLPASSSWPTPQPSRVQGSLGSQGTFGAKFLVSSRRTHIAHASSCLHTTKDQVLLPSLPIGTHIVSPSASKKTLNSKDPRSVFCGRGFAFTAPRNACTTPPTSCSQQAVAVTGTQP